VSSQNREDWPLVPFGDFVELSQNGCGIRRGTSGNHTVVLRLADVSLKGEIASSGLRKIQLDSEIREKYSLKHDDLLVIRVNGSRSIAGQIVRYSGPEGYVFCDHFIRFRLKESLLDPKFAVAAFKSRFLRSQVEAGIVSSAGQNTVSQKTYSEILVPLPSLNEQRRIAERIEALQRRTRRARQALDAIPPLIEKFRQSVLASAFRGDLTADWREQNPDVEPASVLLERIDRTLDSRNQPRRWLTARFGSIMENHDSRRVPLKRADRAKRPGKHPYYGASGVIDSIDDFLFDGEFLLIAEDGANLMARRTPIAFRAQGRFWVNNHAHVVQSTPGLLLKFVEHYINSINIRQYVSGSAQPKLTQANLNKIPIPVPPEEEQRQIVHIIRAAFARAKTINDALSSAAADLGKLDQSILAKAFRGELVPQDPNDEPAFVLLERIRAEKASQEPPRRRRRSSTSSPRPAKADAPSPAEPSPQPERPEEKAEPSGDVSGWVKNWLSENPGWHARADVIAAVEIDVGDWNRAIEELLASGEVERTGEKRGTRYRFRGDDRSLVAWWFAEHPGWHSRQEVLEDLEIDAGTWNPAIRELVAEGEVVRTGEKRGTRYRWWEDEEGE